MSMSPPLGSRFYVNTPSKDVIYPQLGEVGHIIDSCIIDSFLGLLKLGSRILHHLVGRAVVLCLVSNSYYCSCSCRPGTLKSANIFAMAILGPIAKFNSCQYFRLYGIHLVVMQIDTLFKGRNIKINACMPVVLSIEIAKFNFPQYQLRAVLPILMLTNFTWYTVLLHAY